MEAAREIAGLVSNSGNKLMLDSETLLLNRAFAFRQLSTLAQLQLTQERLARVVSGDGKDSKK